MTSLNDYIPKQMSVSLTAATLWKDAAKSFTNKGSLSYFTSFQYLKPRMQNQKNPNIY